jgi:hypothetical protein
MSLANGNRFMLISQDRSRELRLTTDLEFGWNVN